MDANEIYYSVREHYGTYAKRQFTEDDEDYNLKIAQAFGYSEEELACIPKEANLGVSCGNPFATANINEREFVIDLGCGAGFDVFLAASKVGKEGKVIGVDMNQEMLKLAHRNLEKSQVSNVSFLETSITSIPLPSETADCIISNCVINLVPEKEKPKVFHEIFRLLKPGGRVAVSDLVAKKELLDDMKHNMALYVGCIAGASLGSDYEKYLEDAGFRGILIIDKHSDLNLYKEGHSAQSSTEMTSASTNCCSSTCCSFNSKKDTTAVSNSLQCEDNQTSSEKVNSNGCCGKECCEKAGPLLADLDINEWIASVQIYALKPGN